METHHEARPLHRRDGQPAERRRARGLPGCLVRRAHVGTERGPLTNLAHLDFLTDTVSPPAQAGHTTYRLGSEPGIGVLWVYANHLPDGGYQRTGGGPYDPAANRYGQGSYDADDISRAAIVYLRHWLRSGD